MGDSHSLKPAHTSLPLVHMLSERRDETLDWQVAMECDNQRRSSWRDLPTAGELASPSLRSCFADDGMLILAAG
jgi:hypothetical protein